MLRSTDMYESKPKITFGSITIKHPELGPNIAEVSIIYADSNNNYKPQVVTVCVPAEGSLEDMMHSASVKLRSTTTELLNKCESKRHSVKEGTVDGNKLSDGGSNLVHPRPYTNIPPPCSVKCKECSFYIHLIKDGTSVYNCTLCNKLHIGIQKENIKCSYCNTSHSIGEHLTKCGSCNVSIVDTIINNP